MAIRFVACLLFTACASVASAAVDPEDGDIRDLKVGVSVNALPGSGYTGFACAGDDGGRALTGWRDYRRCPPNDDGLTEVSFRYDDDTQTWASVNDKWEGTKIAGHPVKLSILIDDNGFVETIRAVTDPDARPYMRKKAYLLSLRVKARYGREGWSCERRPPGDGRQPIGGVFIDERCEKDYRERRLYLQTQLFRDSGGDAAGETVNRTRFEVVGDKQPI